MSDINISYDLENLRKAIEIQKEVEFELEEKRKRERIEREKRKREQEFEELQRLNEERRIRELNTKKPLSSEDIFCGIFGIYILVVDIIVFCLMAKN